ncbi:MAG: peptidylprolyl isomerase [Actinomycetota bacterium]
MSKQAKRQRKKDHRDQQRMEYAEQLKRRRIARLAGIGGVLGVVLTLALTGGGDDTERTSAGSSPSPSPEARIAACGAEPPPPADPQQYESAPPMTIDNSVDYAAVIRTSCGDIEFDLLEEKARQTVNNFIFLARDGYYDGLIWHRVERNAVIQAGDPNGFNGQPPDGPGYSIPDELPERPREYVYGIVGMANSGPNSGGSQFFIVVHPADQGPAGYRPFYSIFGEVDPGSYETLDAIEAIETDIGNPDPAEAVKPIVPIYIESIEIVER